MEDTDSRDVTTGEATKHDKVEPVEKKETEEETPKTEPLSPASKKKRGAERQITKDDYDAEDPSEKEENGNTHSSGFPQASADVLASRRILKAKRPLDSSGGASQASVDRNPFASTSLTVGEKKDSSTTDDTTTAKKVFGSGTGFSGFKAASNGSSGVGFGSSTGFAGFGTQSTRAPSTSGFGAVSASETQKAGTSSIFGKKTDSDAATKFVSATSDSLFGLSSHTGKSPFSFGFGNSSSKAKDRITSDGNKSGGTGSQTQTSALPEHVDLSTGEENERIMHECRCKSFKWVLSIPQDSASTATASAGTESAPSVQPSASFQNKNPVSKQKSDEEEKTDDGKDKSSEDKVGSKEEMADSASTDTSYRWQELGVGPVKLLQNESDPAKARMVQRRESSPNGPATKVILNLNVWKESKAQLKNGQENYLSFTTLVESGKAETFLLKFKEVQQAQAFAFHLEGVLAQAKSCFVHDK